MKSKVCSICKLDKSYTEFYLRDGKPHSYCKPCHTKYTVDRNKELGKEKRSEYARTSRLRKTYSLERDAYNTILAAQKGCCAICLSPSPGGRGDWAVDHCHTTGVVRGILCIECNLGLGKFKDNIVVLEKAIKYLQKDPHGNN